MKKYLIIMAVMMLSLSSFSQTSKQFINGLSNMTVLDKFGNSNLFMRALREADYAQIPAPLINAWNSQQTKYINEEGNERVVSESFFDECVRPIGKIQMRSGYSVVLFCKFEDEGAQKFAIIASFNSSGNILSIQDCYAEEFEMTGFLKKNGITNQLIILTSGEEFVTEDIVTLNSNGLFQTISYKEIENYNFD